MPAIGLGFIVNGLSKDSHGTVAESEAFCNAAPASPAPGERPQAAARGVGGDAPPSNTASNSSIPPGKDLFRPLRWGVDSLYLSYRGTLHEERETQLAELKFAAQSRDPSEVALAQLRLAGHIFEVKDKAFGLFSFVIEDNAYRIALRRGSGKKLPMAYVKISSHRLASETPEVIEAEVRSLLADLGTLESDASISRIDLFVDFQSTVDMESWDRHAWITKAGSVHCYSDDKKFSGWTVGLGGPIGARLYDKTLEVSKSGKAWIHPLWLEAGGDVEARVWRLEFEFKRAILAQLGSTYLTDVLAVLGGLWRYATVDWLRLAVPNSGDATRSRWLTHPLWDAVAALDWGAPPALLSRTFSPARAPDMGWVLQQSRSLLTTFMAMRGLDEYCEAFDYWNRAIESDLGRLGEQIGLDPDAIIREAVGLKHRRFNTALNLDAIPDEERFHQIERELAEAAREYEHASRGGAS